MPKKKKKEEETEEQLTRIVRGLTDGALADEVSSRNVGDRL